MSKPHSEHPGVHTETIPTRERIAKAHSRLPAEWHGWHAQLANGGAGHFAYHNLREACYICTLLDDLDSLEEQLEATQRELEYAQAVLELVSNSDPALVRTAAESLAARRHRGSVRQGAEVEAVSEAQNVSSSLSERSNA